MLEELSGALPPLSEDLALDEWLRATAERELARRANLRRSTSDERGEFRFEGLSTNARFRLRPAAPDLRLQLPSRIPLYGVGASPLGDVRTMELARLEFELTRADGGGRIVALSPPDAERRVRFELVPAGRYRLVCRPKGGEEAATDIEVPSAGVVRAPE